MSTEITNYNTKNYLVQEYNAEWEVEKLSSLGTKSIRTPIFSPVPNADLKLCFELWYQVITVTKNKHEVSCFKLVLLKLGEANTVPTLKLKMDVTVNYSDGSIYQKYKSPVSISGENISTVTCVDVTSEVTGSYADGIHKQKMRSDKLIIKFHTKFYGHLCSPAEYYQKMDNLDNLRSFVRDFKSIYDREAFSDVVFIVEKKIFESHKSVLGNLQSFVQDLKSIHNLEEFTDVLSEIKRFPAHKSVLAAHSPVFMKMLEHDFVESKTNTITITDYDSETFENFLKYLYSGEIENKTWPFVGDLYMLSDKYVVQSLKQDCAGVIASCINSDNVFDILEMAYFYDDKKLKQEAVSFFVEKFKELSPSENWKTLVSKNPLIGYDVLYMQSNPP